SLLTLKVMRGPERSDSGLTVDNLPQRLIQICNQIVRVLETDRQPRHPCRHPGALELLGTVTPLRRQHRQATQALDTAQARRTFDQTEAIEEPRGSVEPATEIDTDHPAESRHLARRQRGMGMGRGARG